MLSVNQIAAYKELGKFALDLSVQGALVFSQNTEFSRTANTLAGKGPFP